MEVDDRMAELAQHSRNLRLTHLSGNWSGIIHAAQVENPTYLEYSLTLMRTETEYRRKRELQSRLKLARLPGNCDLDKFDFGHSAGITRQQLKQLRELLWVEQGFNAIFMGPSGTGKTFVAAGLVKDAVMKGMNALFMTMDDLVGVLRTKDMSPKSMGEYRRILRCDLLAIDDIMLMPLKNDEAISFFNLINALHEKASIIITTNKAPTEWVKVLNDPVLTTALLDRLLFHADIVKLDGTSYRMENRKGFLDKE